MENIKRIHITVMHEKWQHLMKKQIIFLNKKFTKLYAVRRHLKTIYNLKYYLIFQISFFFLFFSLKLSTYFNSINYFDN